jgi:hypothetical protein
MAKFAGYGNIQKKDVEVIGQEIMQCFQVKLMPLSQVKTNISWGSKGILEYSSLY